MTGLEIFITIILLLVLPIVGIKLGKHVAHKITFNTTRKQKILQDIKDALQAGLNGINATQMSEQDLKKLKIKKDKFLAKAYQFISELAIVCNVKLEKKVLRDVVLNQDVIIDFISSVPKTFSNDYSFAMGIITNLIESSTFPQKEDYIKLNNLYKHYKRLNKYGNSE